MHLFIRSHNNQLLIGGHALAYPQFLLFQKPNFTMAKINHNNVLDIIRNVLDDARDRGVMFLKTDDNVGYSGEIMHLRGEPLKNFGTCGYMGVEFDERLINKSVEFTRKHGTQFSISRAYVTSNVNVELEQKLGKMFGYPVIVQSSTSTTHVSAIPSLVSYKDMIILDQQVHMSVQSATQITRQKGVKITKIRHNRMDMLDQILAESHTKYEKIWYFVDGVYSMYGDVAPFKEIQLLMDKYPNLYIYIDDAHGIGWFGKNGRGYAIETLGGLNERTILSTTLAKGFGTVGGILVLPNKATYQKIRSFGGPLTYSHPLPPATIGAATAMVDICLTDEIYEYQQELQDKMDYCNDLLAASGLPVVSDPLTPIYFIGMGQPKTGYEMCMRLLNEGYYTSMGIFPAVAISNTGIRFTINRHQSKRDIKGLIDAMIYHFPKVLEQENRTEEEILHVFNLKKQTRVETHESQKIIGNYLVEYYTSIQDINQTEWDHLLGDRGCFNYQGLISQELFFSNNPKQENNFTFHYFIIRDKASQEPLLASFLTFGLHKDDMLEPEGLSYNIEQIRKTDPFYLTSKNLMTGSFLTEGDHIYLDRNRSDWKQILRVFFNEISALGDSLEADGLMLRDLKADDTELNTYMLEEGFVKTMMPNTNIVDLTWDSFETYFNTVSKRRRKMLRQEVLAHAPNFHVEIVQQVPDDEQASIYGLMQNIKDSNLAFNVFDYPTNIVDKMSKDYHWEFIYLYLKEQTDMPIGVVCCHRTGHNYCPLLAGMNYDYLESHELYKQILYRILLRGMELNAKRIYLGFTADETKRKFGAEQVPMAAFVRIKDHFNMDVMASMANTKINV